MKNPEEAIERVLRGLREAEAPAGMEARILRTMQVRAVGKASRRPWLEWFAMRGRAWRIAGGAAVAAIVGFALLMTWTQIPGRIAGDVRGEAVVKDLTGVKEVVPQRLKPQDNSGDYGTAEAVPLSKAYDVSARAGWRFGDLHGKTERTSTDAANYTVGGSIVREGSQADGAVDYDSLAMSEMLAPSRQPPPLPLTHQEALLAQVVRKGDPEQVADLKPEVRAKQIEVSKAEFHDFFQPMPVDDSE